MSDQYDQFASEDYPEFKRRLAKRFKEHFHIIDAPSVEDGKAARDMAWQIYLSASIDALEITLELITARIAKQNSLN